MSDVSKIRKSHKDYTTAVVFAMGFEMWAFRYMLDKLHEPLALTDGDPNNYHLGEVCGHNVVLVTLPGEQGNSAASRVGTNLSRTFPSIRWRLLVGVGGGVSNKKHHIRLGDVVISSPSRASSGVSQYDLGRETNEGFERKGFIHHPPEDLRAIVEGMKDDVLEEQSKMRSFLDTMLSKNPKITAKYKRPPIDTDVLFPDDVRHTAPEGESCLDSCDTSKAIPRPPRGPEDEPTVWYGLIASGNNVIASTTSRAEKIDRLKMDGVQADVYCFEMEAAGFMTAFPCLVIRGISDYADSHKHKEWQPYASAVAAACAKDVLARIPAPAADESGGDLPSSSDEQVYHGGRSVGGGQSARRITNHVGKGFISNGGPVSGTFNFDNRGG